MGVDFPGTPFLACGSRKLHRIWLEVPGGWSRQTSPQVQKSVWVDYYRRVGLSEFAELGLSLSSSVPLSPFLLGKVNSTASRDKEGDS